ncbi:MAG: hypothetical protein FWD80_07365, partial [Propionibacteriaceae bacterium]|nr:hypothetical protein [Propionibacteriaceae bacterium]
DVFVGPDDDSLGYVATWVDGVRSLCVGLSANKSLVSGQAVHVADLDLGDASTQLGLPTS